MAATQAANLVEKAVGHGDTATVHTDISNYSKNEAGVETGEKILAAVWNGKNDVTTAEMPKPRVIDGADVVVRVTGSTVCGSDLHLYHGTIPQLQKGDVLGHECCGVVESIGPDIKDRKPGQRVTVSFPIACGTCKRCTAQQYSQCENTNENSITNAMYGKRTAGIFGYSHFTGGFAGGQAEYLRVPYGDVNLLPISDEVPDEKALYLSDVIATSWHCVVDTGVKEGDTVAVWGAGPIGQMAVEFAFYHGAKRVIVIDGGEGAWRLGFVKGKVPRVEILDFSALPKGENVSSQLRKMTDHQLDVCLECVGGEYAKGWVHFMEQMVGAETDTSEIVNEMITAVRPFGRVGLTGVYAGFTNHFNIGSLMQTGVRLIGNGQAPVQKYWKDLLELIRKGDIDPLHMVSHRFRLEDIAEVYAKFDKREGGIQKVYLETKHSQPAATQSPALTTI
ncbi:zinc-dependent alcohol dehydrogenase [Aspergillus undulatus]|uniref:zinc-dependent alcohol dehydrogenase n=1 Tax=Aspergillus undulatus TaxID=1810928 RepID=UPI003CCD3E03